MFNPIKDVRAVTAGKFSQSNAHGRNRDGSRKNGRKTIQRADYCKRDNVWTYAVGGRNHAPDFPRYSEHPAVMPLALAKDHVRTWTNAGDVVLDPMAGAGTTIRAAKDLGRQGIGIEIHRPYVDLAIERLRQDVLQT